MKWFLSIICLIIFNLNLKAQLTFKDKFNSLEKIVIDSGVTLTFDEPSLLAKSNKTKIIIFALPNGNTTAQTFGKRLIAGDDWHFDIQHIGAQTAFIRKADPKTNYIVVYCENAMKSWPAWRRKFKDADQAISKIVSLISERYAAFNPKLTLSGHSGGGSFIFGYINSQAQIPAIIERIGFLDATYGYETAQHLEKLKQWLKQRKRALQVISYNDSVVVYNGKPLVSPTGGTWYRSQLMAKDLTHDFKLSKTNLTDRLYFTDLSNFIAFKLIKNPEAKIYHTVLVEKNGFIDLIFGGTSFQNLGYKFWENRAYDNDILE
jgi:hypothetical protein